MTRGWWLGLVVLVGCSANDSGGPGASGGFGGQSGGGGAAAFGGGGLAGGGGGGAAGAAAGGGGGLAGTGGGGNPPVGEVYGHSATTLYKLEPFSKVVTSVGTFDCTSSMWDIALDASGIMVGVTGGLGGGAVVSIDKATAKCFVVKSGTFPNSLTYLPAGTLLPTEEALVGYDRSNYIRIDRQTATIVSVGNLNPNSTGQAWESSGDIVSIIGAKTYLTAKPVLAGPDTVDYLLEVDPVTGKALAVLGSTGFQDLWGLGYWAGVAYGFSDTGQLVQIDLATGAGALIPIQSVPGLSFWGAGVTTAAPIVPPR